MSNLLIAFLQSLLTGVGFLIVAVTIRNISKKYYPELDVEVWNWWIRTGTLLSVGLMLWSSVQTHSTKIELGSRARLPDSPTVVKIPKKEGSKFVKDSDRFGQFDDRLDQEKNSNETN